MRRVLAFDTFLHNYQTTFWNRAEEEITRFFAPYVKDFSSEVFYTKNLISAEGKRIRSAMLAFVCEGEHDILRLEALVEILHVALLIADDVMDGATTRRRQPAFHLRIGNKDRAMAWSNMVCSRLHSAFQEICGDKGAKLYAEILEATWRGQLWDMAFRGDASRISASDFDRCYGLKTGIYGFYFPIALALLVMGKSWDDEVLRTDAMVIGTAFQCADDLRIWDFHAQDKSLESDFINRQMTYPLWWLSKHCKDPIFGTQESFEAWRTRTYHHFGQMGGWDHVRDKIASVTEHAWEDIPRVKEVWNFVRTRTFSVISGLVQ